MGRVSLPPRRRHHRSCCSLCVRVCLCRSLDISRREATTFRWVVQSWRRIIDSSWLKGGAHASPHSPRLTPHASHSHIYPLTHTACLPAALTVALLSRLLPLFLPLQLALTFSFFFILFYSISSPPLLLW